MQIWEWILRYLGAFLFGKKRLIALLCGAFIPFFVTYPLDFPNDHKKYSLYEKGETASLTYFPDGDRVVLKYLPNKAKGAVLREFHVSSTEDVEASEQVASKSLREEASVSHETRRSLLKKFEIFKYRDPQEENVIHLPLESVGSHTDKRPFFSHPLGKFEVNRRTYKIRLHKGANGDILGLGVVDLTDNLGNIHKLKKAPYLMVKDKQEELAFFLDKDIEFGKDVFRVGFLIPKEGDHHFENLELRQFFILKKNGAWQVIHGQKKKESLIRERSEVALLDDSARHRPVFQLHGTSKYLSGLQENEIQRRVKGIVLKGLDGKRKFKESYLECIFDQGLTDYGEKVSRLRDSIRKKCLRSADLNVAFSSLVQNFKKYMGEFLDPSFLRVSLQQCYKSESNLKRLESFEGNHFVYLDLESLKTKRVRGSWKDRLLECQSQVENQAVSEYLTQRVSRDLPALVSSLSNRVDSVKAFVRDLKVGCEGIDSCREDYLRIRKWIKNFKDIDERGGAIFGVLTQCFDGEKFQRDCLRDELRTRVVKNSSTLLKNEIQTLSEVLSPRVAEGEYLYSKERFHSCLASSSLTNLSMGRLPASSSTVLAKDMGIGKWVFQCARQSLKTPLILSFKHRLEKFGENFVAGVVRPKHFRERLRGWIRNETQRFSKRDFFSRSQQVIKEEFEKSLVSSQARVFGFIIEFDQRDLWDRLSLSDHSKKEKFKERLHYAIDGVEKSSLSGSIEAFLKRHYKLFGKKGLKAFGESFFHHYISERNQIWAKYQLNRFQSENPVSWKGVTSHCLKEQAEGRAALEFCQERFLLELGGRIEIGKWQSRSSETFNSQRFAAQREEFRNCLQAFDEHRDFYQERRQVSSREWLAFCRSFVGVQLEKQKLESLTPQDLPLHRDLASLSKDPTQLYSQCLEDSAPQLEKFFLFHNQTRRGRRIFEKPIVSHYSVELYNQFAPQQLVKLAGTWISQGTSRCFREVAKTSP